MAGRPPTYQSTDERPVSVSLRIPKALYDQAQQWVRLRRMTLTEALLAGLQLWLETPTGPRDLVLTDDSNTVIQQLQEMVDAAVQHALAKQHPMPTLTPVMPESPLPKGHKVCGKGHAPYPATRAECPHCVRLRKQKQRAHKAKAQGGP